MPKIISIDPSGNGVTAIVVVDYDYSADEPVVIIDFAQVDFRAKDETNSERVKEIRYRQTEAVIEFVAEHNPYCVILENFIMFKQQMGEHGQSFVTAELIGALDLELRRRKIPVIKPRSYDIRKIDGYGKAKVKYGLRTQDLHSRGILGKGKRNRTTLMVNGVPYDLIEYQIGAKNDHLLMAIKHLINEIEYKKPDLFAKTEKIKSDRFQGLYE
ncbi:MAG: hypothetical protein ACK5MR_10105 [Cumulibacter sp.]